MLHVTISCIFRKCQSMLVLSTLGRSVVCNSVIIWFRRNYTVVIRVSNVDRPAALIATRIKMRRRAFNFCDSPRASVCMQLNNITPSVFLHHRNTFPESSVRLDRSMRPHLGIRAAIMLSKHYAGKTESAGGRSLIRRCARARGKINRRHLFSFHQLDDGGKFRRSACPLHPPAKVPVFELERSGG